MNFSLSHQACRALPAYLAAAFVVLLILVRPEEGHVFNASPAMLQVNVGNTASIRVADASGEVSARSSDRNVATVSYDGGIALVKGLSAGSVTVTLWDRERSLRVAVAVTPAIGEVRAVVASNLSAPMEEGPVFHSGSGALR